MHIIHPACFSDITAVLVHTILVDVYFFKIPENIIGVENSLGNLALGLKPWVLDETINRDAVIFTASLLGITIFFDLFVF